MIWWVARYSLSATVGWVWNWYSARDWRRAFLRARGCDTQELRTGDGVWGELAETKAELARAKERIEKAKSLARRWVSDNTIKMSDVVEALHG